MSENSSTTSTSTLEELEPEFQEEAVNHAETARKLAEQYEYD